MELKKRKRIVRPHPRKQALRRLYLQMTKDERFDFSEASRASGAYISQIYGGWCLCGAVAARNIAEASGGAVPAYYLRPDLYERPFLAPVIK